jgi:hypothetical protein
VLVAPQLLETQEIADPRRVLAEIVAGAAKVEAK